MRFPNLIYDEIVQVDDRVRFDMQKSFATKDENGITDIEISFDSVNYISVFVEGCPERWYLDYAFNTDGQTSAWVKVTTGLGSTEKEFSFEVISEVNDALFSSDSQLFAEETELKEYIPKGRSGFKYAHRVAQRNIVRMVDGEGLRKIDADKKTAAFTKSDLFGNVYISEWSVYETMLNIFEDLRLKGNDVFKDKREHYQGKLTMAKKNAFIRLDYNGDGETDADEGKNVQNKFLKR